MKRVYTFGNGQAEGRADMKNLLGGKGANLAEMNLIGIPVPPGFTITTEVCGEYYSLGREKVIELLKEEGLRDEVKVIIGRCLPATFKLGIVAFIEAMVIGITLGIIAAFTKKKWVENAVMFIATIGVSVPSFLYALLLMIVFGVVLHWLPIIGLKSPLHYILPSLSLALSPIATISRLVRSSMKEVMKQDYIVLARSKGTPMLKIILKHGLKNCLIPVVNYAGPMLSYLLTGSFVIENLFSIPGIGAEFTNSVTNRDYTMIMALTILFGVLIIVANIATDILVAFIDPRVKLEKKKS